jgi:hypothetical protein
MARVPTLLLFLSGPAFAGIVSTDGDIEVVDAPASVANGALESNQFARVWAEGQDVLLPADLPVDIDQAGTYQAGSAYSVGSIAAGTLVRVHYVHVDSLFSNQATMTGSITFDSPILGVMVTGTGLAGTDSFNEAATTFEPDGTLRRFETTGTDVISISPTSPETLTFTAQISSGMDQLRVFTMGGLSLQVAGSCPGDLAVDTRGSAPGAEVGFVTGTMPGSFVVPSGPCAGTVLGLADPTFEESVIADVEGRIALLRNAAGRTCGTLGQAVDLTTCEVSDVVAVP